MTSCALPHHSLRATVGLIALFICVITSSSLAQQPDIRPYHTEEDLWEALSEGEVDFDQFLDLLDLVRSQADSTVAPSADWEQLPGSDAGYLVEPDSTYTLTKPIESAPNRWPLSVSFRGGYDAELGGEQDGDGYSVFRARHRSLRALLDIAQREGEGASWRRRSLSIDHPHLHAQAGTVEPRWGRGLVVGRRSRVLTSSDLDGSFAQPTRSRFNGVWLALHPNEALTLEVVGSDIRSPRQKDQFLAAQALARHRRWELGASVGSGRIEDRQSGDYWLTGVGGGHIRFQHGSYAVIGEFAATEEGATAKAVEVLWPLSRGRFHAMVWSYGRHYLNPWGGGPGHSDTRKVTLPGTAVAFSSRTAGERGLSFVTRLDVSDPVQLRLDWMSHREEPGAGLQHQAVVRLRYKRGDNSVTPFLRGRIDEDRAETYSFGGYADFGPELRRVNLRAELGRHHADAVPFVRAGAGFTLHVNGIVRFAPAVRWNDPDLDTPGDGYWYFYFTETVVPAAGARLEAALVWKHYENNQKDDPVELRVRVVLK